MTTARILLTSASALALASCSLFKGGSGGNDYDTPGASAGGVADNTSNPYGVPGSSAGESAPYQPVNPPAGGGGNPTYSPAAYEDNSASTPPAAAPANPSSTAPRHTPAATAPAAGGSRVHVVGKGDTLWGLSRKYGVSVDAIKKANNMTKDTAVLGSKLVIPAH